MNINMNMDSFVNKLRNTVSQVAYTVNSSVNTVMPGNLIEREYNLLKKRCCHGCPGFNWDIYDAMKSDSLILPNSLSGTIKPIVGGQSSIMSNEPRDRSTHDLIPSDKQLYSVFVFEKSQLDRLNKIERDLVIEHLKRSVTQLTRLRHPSILTIQHSLEESRSTLAFVTEHIFGSLDVIFKLQRQYECSSKSNTSKTLNSRVTGSLVELDNSLDAYSGGPSDGLDDFCFVDTVQIKAGLLQICDGLKFLHQDAKMLHRNLCLENIFINTNNVWKVGGFDFCCTPIQQDKADNNNPLYAALKEAHKTIPSCLTPNWSCSAPEHSNTSTVTVSSDIYSLGLIACAALNWNSGSVDLSYEAGLVSDTYKRGTMTRELIDSLSVKVKSDLQKFTSISSVNRPTLDAFQKLTIFDDAQVQTLRYLDANFSWDNLKKVEFYTGLKDILPKLSHQVKVNRVANALVKEFFNIDMLPYVLINYLLIIQESNAVEFKAKLLPPMRNIFTLVSPPSVPSMLLENLPTLTELSKNCLQLFKELSLPLIYRSLQSNNNQLQEQCLVVLPSAKKLLDSSCLRDNLLPILHQLCNGTNILSVRVKCLVCIGNLVDVIENWLIVEKVVPILKDVPSREPAVIMSTIGIIKVLHANMKLTKETIANSIMPILFTLCIEKDLNLQQFQSLITLIKDLVSKLERDQLSTLKKSNNSEDSTKKFPPMVIQNPSRTGPSLNQLSEGASQHINSLIFD